MALRLIAMSLRQTVPKAPVCTRTFSHADYAIKTGNRDVVGFGVNGTPLYIDRVEYPMPAIRFRENTPEIMALREKEKGDWKKLTLQEKKALYRASFCQTFAEFDAPLNIWKPMLSAVFIVGGMALLFSMWMNLYIYPELPKSFSEESKKAQLKRMLTLEVNPIEGLSSKWDYENKRWK